MADNVGYTPGSGATIAADDISGILFQRVKVTTGADGAASDVADGAPMPVSNSTYAQFVSGNASNTNGNATVCIAAQGAGVKVYLTDVTITNTSSTDIFVEIADGSTVKWTCPVPAGGGFTKSFDTPLAGSANTAWNFDPSAAASTIYCSMSGFKSTV